MCEFAPCVQLRALSSADDGQRLIQNIIVASSQVRGSEWEPITITDTRHFGGYFTGHTDVWNLLL